MKRAELEQMGLTALQDLAKSKITDKKKLIEMLADKPGPEAPAEEPEPEA